MINLDLDDLGRYVPTQFHAYCIELKYCYRKSTGAILKIYSGGFQQLCAVVPSKQSGG